MKRPYNANKTSVQHRNTGHALLRTRYVIYATICITVHTIQYIVLYFTILARC